MPAPTLSTKSKPGDDRDRADQAAEGATGHRADAFDGW
jgi:hypothetical protein